MILVIAAIHGRAEAVGTTTAFEGLVHVEGLVGVLGSVDGLA